MRGTFIFLPRITPIFTARRALNFEQRLAGAPEAAPWAVSLKGAGGEADEPPRSPPTAVSPPPLPTHPRTPALRKHARPRRWKPGTALRAPAHPRHPGRDRTARPGSGPRCHPPDPPPRWRGQRGRSPPAACLEASRRTDRSRISPKTPPTATIPNSPHPRPADSHVNLLG